MRVVINNEGNVRPFVSLDCGDVFRFTDGTPGTWMATEDFTDENGDTYANAICLDDYRVMVVRNEREVRVAKSATLNVEI